MTIVTPVSSSAPRGTLDITAMKEHLSLAHLSMIAANAGLEVATYAADYNGVDATVRSYAKYPGMKGSEIDIQLKCTSQAALQHKKHISWPLERSNYDKLQDPERYTIGVVAVLVVQADYNKWLHQDQSRLLARSCMYFSVATTWPAFTGTKATKTVQCLRTDILDVPNLLDLMQLSAAHKASTFL